MLLNLLFVIPKKEDMEGCQVQQLPDERVTGWVCREKLDVVSVCIACVLHTVLGEAQKNEAEMLKTFRAKTFQLAQLNNIHTLCVKYFMIDVVSVKSVLPHLIL